MLFFRSKHKRYIDSQRLNPHEDFVVRRRIPTVVQFILLFGISFLLILLASHFSPNANVFMTCLAVVVGALSAFTILSVQRNRDLALATEFQNALFASALGVNNMFSIIVKRDGTINYMDLGFKQMFPEFSKKASRYLQELLEMSGVSRDDKERIGAALERDAFDKVMLKLRSADGKENNVILSVDPLKRPKGFMLLQGREYIEMRTGMQSVQSLSIGSLQGGGVPSELLDALPVGVYVLDANGNITYANRQLDEWLGYAPGEILQSKISVQQLFFNEADSQKDMLDDLQGQVTLRTREGRLFAAHVVQHVARNEMGKVRHLAAIVQDMQTRHPQKNAQGGW